MDSINKQLQTNKQDQQKRSMVTVLFYIYIQIYLFFGQFYYILKIVIVNITFAYTYMYKDNNPQRVATQQQHLLHTSIAISLQLLLIIEQISKLTCSLLSHYMYTSYIILHVFPRRSDLFYIVLKLVTDLYIFLNLEIYLLRIGL